MPSRPSLVITAVLCLALAAWAGFRLRQSSAHAGMVRVPAGDYEVSDLTTGSHRVHLSSFYIDRFPVAAADYNAFLQSPAGRSLVPSRRRFPGPAEEESEARLPATDMTYAAAAAYAQSVGKRLPTAAEWEACARGRDSRAYPWGSDIQDVFLDVAYSHPYSIGAYPAGASPCGAQDLVGNVFHWTCSAVQAETNNLSVERRGPLRMVKGGAWGFVPRWNRCDFWTWVSENMASPFLGFRCVQATDDANLRTDRATVRFISRQNEAREQESLRQVLSYELRPDRSPPRLLRSHIASLAKGLTVADVGAGVGYLTLLLSRAVGEAGTVYAVDIDSDVLDFTAAYCRALKVHNVRTVVSQAADIVLPPKSCDEIYLLGTAHCLSDDIRQPFFDSCARALKKDGQLLLIDYNHSRVPLAVALLPTLGFTLLRQDRGPQDNQMVYLYRWPR